MDLNFHTIPYHGHLELVESHYVKNRSRRQQIILALQAQISGQRTAVYTDATITEDTCNDAV